ncbi:MAG: aromatic amino acid transport family protein [Granulosicoccus sp.]
MTTLIVKNGNPITRLVSLSSVLKNLPPFWIAFALTLTETVGAGTLALPIAFATVGPLVGVTLLVFLGLINLLTVYYLAEVCTRSDSVRSGNGFVGKLVEDYLGAYASYILRLSLFALCCTFLVAYYTGFASVLSAATGVPAPVWVTVVFAFSLMLTFRKTLTGTLAAALVTGAVNITILLIISVIAMSHATVENVLHAEIPGIGDRPFDTSHIKLVFGVVLVSYFGHLSVSNCAKTVLERDPSGRSLKRGTVAAMLVAILIYCVWTISVVGAVGSVGLTGLNGTALVPLAEKVGPSIYLFGVVFAVLGLGMSSVHFGLGIVNLAKEIFCSSDSDTNTIQSKDRFSKLAAIIPMFCVYLYVQWTYASGISSFTAPLELVGVLFVPVLAGVFPVLLLIACQGKLVEKYALNMPVVFTSSWVLGLVLALFIASLVLHGLVLWVGPLAQVSAILVAVVMLVLVVDTLRQNTRGLPQVYNLSMMLKGGGN